MKDTLNLPKTAMPIRAELPKFEPAKYESWHRDGAYQRMLRSREPDFILHDGPPYANGPIHIGHAVNKILKDFALKFQYFNGKSVQYVPGWDCHGLPIEKKAKELVGTGNLRETCRSYATQQIEQQRTQFKTLGVLADWDHPYRTMDFSFESEIYWRLCTLVKAGFVEERLKPVFWSWAEKTALAEAEVEYKDKEDTAAYIGFPMENGRFEVLVWTTTPWTIPANSGVALNPNEVYCVARKGEKRYIIQGAAYERLKAKGIVDDQEMILDPRSLSTALLNPFNGLPSRLVLDEGVSSDGTGCVHLAPGHGEYDYQVGLANNLPVYMDVNEDGYFVAERGNGPQIERLGNFKPGVIATVAGLHVFPAGKHVLDVLKRDGYLAGVEQITHSYPYCWRSNTPVIFRATNQWFIRLDDLRDVATKGLEGVSFLPENAKNKLTSMVSGRPDWCISRQREWGVPIAFFRHKITRELLLDPQVLDRTRTAFAEFGCDCWWDKPNEYFLADLNADEYEKVFDILDVWFDSGLTWTTVPSRQNLNFRSQADLYLEGHDQHRGWFQSSLWLSSAFQAAPPYKSVVTHGFVVDQNGEKMAKSKGNVVAPEEVTEKFGADILRHWVASTDYRKEMRCSTEILTRSADNYKKLRNTLRYMVSVLGDEPGPVTHLEPINYWLFQEASRVFSTVAISFEEMNYHVGLHALQDFVSTDLSSTYFNAMKDRLYCDGLDSPRRQQCVELVAQTLEIMLSQLAPVLTYTVDEVLSYCPGWFKSRVGNDVFDLQCRPWRTHFEPESKWSFPANWRAGLAAFHAEFDKLKTAGTIKETLELAIETSGTAVLDEQEVLALVTDKKNEYEVRRELTIRDYTNALCAMDDFLVVGEVRLDCLNKKDWLTTFQFGDREFGIRVSDSPKCPRCWKRAGRKHHDSGVETCWRCYNVLNANENNPNEYSRL